MGRKPKLPGPREAQKYRVGFRALDPSHRKGRNRGRMELALTKPP